MLIATAIMCRHSQPQTDIQIVGTQKLGETLNFRIRLERL